MEVKSRKEAQMVLKIQAGRYDTERSRVGELDSALQAWAWQLNGQRGRWVLDT